ncbi:hypothetical protein S40288_10223 [Stachybotrys chartarum IBT 40288]|nr:hypothetical protein S40288_10223 [Stachybotrys chartarum IBT 40288]
MACICNYIHPELGPEASESLSGTGVDSLFPDNPEFYDLASHLYGPGFVYCWLLLMVSLWVTIITDTRSTLQCPLSLPQGRGISNRMLVFLAFPTCAATDALVQAKLWRGKHRTTALACVKFPAAMTTSQKCPKMQPDLREIPPDVLEVGQRAVSLVGPLQVVYIFLGASFAMYITLKARGYGTILPSRTARYTFYGCYLYALLALIFTHASFERQWLNTMIIISALLTQVAQSFCTIYGAALLVGVLASLGQLKMPTLPGRCRTGRQKWWVHEVQHLLMCIWYIYVGAIMRSNGVLARLTPEPGMPFFELAPDQGISVWERDQMAVLCIGIACLCSHLDRSIRTIVSELAGEPLAKPTTLLEKPLLVLYAIENELWAIPKAYWKGTLNFCEGLGEILCSHEDDDLLPLQFIFVCCLTSCIMIVVFLLCF